MVMLRSQFPDFTLEDSLPALKKIIEDKLMEFPMEHEAIFNVGSMDRGILQHTQVSGLPAVGQVAEGSEYPLDQQYQGFDKTYSAVKYGVMTSITEELLADAQFDVFNRRPEQMVRSMNEARKISAASVFNNGFSAAGPDGVALFHVSHPSIYPGAPTSSNKLGTDADLSLSALESLITVMRQTTDGSGKKVLIRPKYLVVGPSNEFLATELLDSTQKPQAALNGSITEENMVNAVRSRYGLSIVVLDYLTDSDAWFLCGEKGSHELWWFDREKPAVSTDMEFKSDVALAKIKARWAVGYSDWRGVAGTSGA